MNIRDIWLALSVILIWAGNIIAIKIAVTELPPITALALRFGLTALFFLPFLKKIDRHLVLQLFWVSILMGVAHQSLLFVGMDYLSAGLTSIFLQSQIIFATILGVLFFKEKIGWRTICGLLIGIFGICIIYGDEVAGFSVKGFWIIMASALSIAVTYMQMKKLPPVPPATYLCLMNGLAFPFILGAAFALDYNAWTTSFLAADWLKLVPVFLFQILVVGLSHIIWQKLLSRNDMGLVTPFVLLLPVFSIILAVLLLNEAVTWRMILGGTIAMAGVSIILFRRIIKQEKTIVKDI